MIIGITGSLCSGKTELAKYLVQTYDFEAVNLLDVFKKRLDKEAMAEKEDKNEEEKDEKDDMFFEAFYQDKYKPLRMEIIKEQFVYFTKNWGKKFILYPLTGRDEINLMISQFYFVVYEVDAPLLVRFDRFKSKYAKHSNEKLQQFASIDDKIRFEYSHYTHKDSIKRRFDNKTSELLEFHS